MDGMLYCKACLYVVERGKSTCSNCRNGFVAQLGCGACTKDIPRGQNFCSFCSPPAERRPVTVDYVPRESSAEVSITVSPSRVPAHQYSPQLPALIPGLAMGLPQPVPDSYSESSFGAQSEVMLNGQDAQILTRMQNVAALLHVLATEMNGLQGFMQSTRNCIKQARSLATDLQEEVEVRMGPLGRRG
jgi:hypothetical protein